MYIYGVVFDGLYSVVENFGRVCTRKKVRELVSKRLTIR